tara:strand:- start:405 stop:668 length:264 start_codon:yes stop_codon:yes gene_type:complete
MKLTKKRIKEIIKEELLNEAKQVQLQIPIRDKLKVDKILKKKLRLKLGRQYDIGVGKGATFVLELDTKFQDKVLELFIKNRIQVKEL